MKAYIPDNQHVEVLLELTYRFTLRTWSKVRLVSCWCGGRGKIWLTRIGRGRWLHVGISHIRRREQPAPGLGPDLSGTILRKAHHPLVQTHRHLGVITKPPINLKQVELNADLAQNPGIEQTLQKPYGFTLYAGSEDRLCRIRWRRDCRMVFLDTQH